MSIPALNQKVLEFCNSKRGRAVGAGECWDLAEQALTFAGARTSISIMGAEAVNQPDADYRWGTRVNLRAIQPGDIIQYKNFSLSTDFTAPDGSGFTSTINLPHHTAIIAEVYPRGKVKVWEQNNMRNNRAPVLRVVIQNTLHLKTVNYTDASGNVIRTVKHGQVKIYRPQAPPPTRRRRNNRRSKRP